MLGYYFIVEASGGNVFSAHWSGARNCQGIMLNTLNYTREFVGCTSVACVLCQQGGHSEPHPLNGVSCCPVRRCAASLTQAIQYGALKRPRVVKELSGGTRHESGGQNRPSAHWKMVTIPAHMVSPIPALLNYGRGQGDQRQDDASFTDFNRELIALFEFEFLREALV